MREKPQLATKSTTKTNKIWKSLNHIFLKKMSTPTERKRELKDGSIEVQKCPADHPLTQLLVAGQANNKKRKVDAADAGGIPSKGKKPKSSAVARATPAPRESGWSETYTKLKAKEWQTRIEACSKYRNNKLDILLAVMTNQKELLPYRMINEMRDTLSGNQHHCLCHVNLTGGQIDCHQTLPCVQNMDKEKREVLQDILDATERELRQKQAQALDVNCDWDDAVKTYLRTVEANDNEKRGFFPWRC